jgi:RNA polymerase sigma-70 factor, ECF subfamily
MDFARIAAGDQLAFEQVFRAHYKSLCAFARQYLRDADKAEDLVQDLFFRLWQDRAKVSVTTSLKSYLFASVRNRCLNALAVTAKVRPLNEELDDRSEDSGVPEDERAYRLGRVQAAIEALPEERGKVFKLSRYEGLKYQEIADRLGISVKTVENQMGKALKTLREELQDVMPLGVLGYLLGWLNHGGWG